MRRRRPGLLSMQPRGPEAGAGLGQSLVHRRRQRWPLAPGNPGPGRSLTHSCDPCPRRPGPPRMHRVRRGCSEKRGPLLAQFGVRGRHGRSTWRSLGDCRPHREGVNPSVSQIVPDCTICLSRADARTGVRISVQLVLATSPRRIAGVDHGIDPGVAHQLRLA
jgi:hypothetical protein